MPACTQEWVHVVSESDTPARERRQGVSNRLTLLGAGCALLAVLAVAAWRSQDQAGRLARSSPAAVSHFVAGKDEEVVAEVAAEDDPADASSAESKDADTADPEDETNVEDKADADYHAILDMKSKSEDDMASAKDDEKKAKADKKDAESQIDAAVEQITKAASDKKKSAKMDDDARTNIKEAKEAIDKAGKDTEEAEQIISDAKEEKAAAKQTLSKADKLQKEADSEKQKVAVVEQEAMDATADERVCVDLPAVQLADAEGEDEFAPIAVDKKINSAEACTLWCKQHKGCKQANFCIWGKTCKLFQEATTEAVSYRDGFNSSYCGEASKKKDLEALIEKAMSHKPDIPPVVECAWDGEDCSESSCCNDEICEWDFSSCKPFACFGGAEGATCMSACYGDQCENKGEGREQREIAAAEEGILVQGTTLYCFMVVAAEKEGRDEWSDPESALAKNIKDKKAGIYECDDHDVFDGELTAITDWSTYLNADLFIKMWKKVQESGKYANNDWTVKVDFDAVFFPKILKQHLGGLKPPQGSRVYVRNTGEKYQFYGALEVLTREALDLYFEKGWKCESQEHDKQAEDYFMKHCLDAIGCDHQVDTDLVNDRSTSPESPTQDCTNGWTVAFHWQRSVNDWNKCREDALAAQEEARKLWVAKHGQ